MQDPLGQRFRPEQAVCVLLRTRHKPGPELQGTDLTSFQQTPGSGHRQEHATTTWAALISQDTLRGFGGHWIHGAGAGWGGQ